MSSRFLFPSDRTAYVYSALGGPILIPDHASLTIYTDEPCTLLADIQTVGHVTIPNSILYTDTAGLIPEFYGPLGVGVNIVRLWAKPIGGVAYPLDANYETRVNDLEVLVTALGHPTNTIHSGDGAPAVDLGIDGDWYIDEIAHAMYGPKASGVWPAPASLVGPTGIQGPQHMYVQEAQPVMEEPGLWIETASDGSVVTFWVGTA
jgi:hypothetical protein